MQKYRNLGLAGRARLYHLRMFSEVEDATGHLHINTVRLKFWLVLFVGFDFCDGLHPGPTILSRFLDAYSRHHRNSRRFYRPFSMLNLPTLFDPLGIFPCS